MSRSFRCVWVTFFRRLCPRSDRPLVWFRDGRLVRAIRPSLVWPLNLEYLRKNVLEASRLVSWKLKPDVVYFCFYSSEQTRIYLPANKRKAWSVNNNRTKKPKISKVFTESVFLTGLWSLVRYQLTCPMSALKNLISSNITNNGRGFLSAKCLKSGKVLLRMLLASFNDIGHKCRWVLMLMAALRCWGPIL